MAADAPDAPRQPAGHAHADEELFLMACGANQRCVATEAALARAEAEAARLREEVARLRQAGGAREADDRARAVAPPSGTRRDEARLR